MNKTPIPRWRVVAQELTGASVTNLIIASPTGEILTLAGTTDKTRDAIRRFAKEHESMRDARFSDTTELAKWLDGLYVLTENGVTVTNQKWPEAQRLIEALQALDTNVPPDWMRTMVFKEMRERLALPPGDEARIGPEETLADFIRASGAIVRLNVPCIPDLPELPLLADGTLDLTGITDAHIWAEEFRRLFPKTADEGTMIGWFANAIMAGYDWGRGHEQQEQKARNRPTDIVIHEVDGELIPGWAIRRATGLERGAQLPTKDGRRMGNAHIIDIEHTDHGVLYTILTDAGNRARMSTTEIEGCFYPPKYVSDVERVLADFDRDNEPPVTNRDKLLALYRWMSRAHFSRPEDEQRAATFGTYLKSMLGHEQVLRTVKVNELALGARFRYQPGGPEYVLLDRTGDGKIAEAEPASVSHQQVFILAGTEQQKRDLILYVEQ